VPFVTEPDQNATAGIHPFKINNLWGSFWRIIVHANEHMGQLIVYARMNGIVPPWSKAGE
jgi:uncharacterized damage-inducible protein DinB